MPGYPQDYIGFITVPDSQSARQWSVATVDTDPNLSFSYDLKQSSHSAHTRSRDPPVEDQRRTHHVERLTDNYQHNPLACGDTADGAETLLPDSAGPVVGLQWTLKIGSSLSGSRMALLPALRPRRGQVAEAQVTRTTPMRWTGSGTRHMQTKPHSVMAPKR